MMWCLYFRGETPVNVKKSYTGPRLMLLSNTQQNKSMAIAIRSETEKYYAQNMSAKPHLKTCLTLIKTI